MKTLIKKTGLSLIAAAMATTVLVPAQADEAELKANLPSFIEDTMQSLNLPGGIGVAIVKDDRIVYTGSFGYADMEAGIKVTDDTSFYIASTTKPMMALAGLTLAEAGKIDLDKSLAAYFPEIDFAPDLKADQINMRHLLAHTHGIETAGVGFATAYTGIHTPETLIEMLRQSTVNQEKPFGEYDYTNEGYNIFAMILERELGKPWQDILAEEVIKPLKMTRTSARMSDTDKPGWQATAPYRSFSPSPNKALYLVKKDNTMQSAGGVIASAKDMARFVIAQLNDGKIDGEQVFPPELIKASQEKQASFERNLGPFKRHGYALGWNLSTFGGEPNLHHFGGFSGNHAQVSFDPKNDLGVIVLMNEAGISNFVAATIGGYAYDMLLDKEGVDKNRREQIASLAQRMVGAKERFKQQAADHAKREWMLSRPFAAYVGKYTHPLLGTISVASKGDNDLELTFGNLWARGAPFPKADTTRIEFIPGTGEVISFNVTDGGVTHLAYDGIEFSRKN